MPIYEGNLGQLINEHRRDEKPRPKILTIIEGMLFQILHALDYIHTSNPQIIHRDIKPANILYHDRGDKFLLTDFGVAKVVDASPSMAGTRWFAAPEVSSENCEQTTKIDIYSLGATIVECFVNVLDEKSKLKWPDDRKKWHQSLQKHLKQQDARFSSMLADSADQRPTARQLLPTFFPRPPLTLSQYMQENETQPSSGRLSLANEAKVTRLKTPAAPTPMDWTRTIATPTFQGDAHGTRRDECTSLFRWRGPSVPLPKAPFLQSVQPEFKRGASVKSAKSRGGGKRKREKGDERLRNVGHTPSDSPGVPEGTSPSKRRCLGPGLQLRSQKVLRHGRNYVVHPNGHRRICQATCSE